MKPATALAATTISMILVTGAFAQDFHGYPCIQDCSGHEAGYNWAEDNNIADESECSGDSNSFVEGCQAYVEEQDGRSTSSDDNSDDQDGDAKE